MLVNDRKKLVGIIDWGDMEIEHPAIDYQCIFTFFPPEGQKRILEIYGPIDEESYNLARLRALMSAATMAAYGLRTNDQALLVEGIWGLENWKRE